MSDALFFFKKSADKPPGKGVHDRVRDPSVYSDLAQISHWRRMLDEFYVAPIEYQDLHFNTAMHLVYAMRASLVDPEKAFLFALESGSDISRLDYHVFESRNLVRLDKEVEAEWTRSDRRERSQEDEAYYIANEAKFSQHPELLEVLLMTQDAELWRTPDRGIPAERRYVLEAIRASYSRGSGSSRGR